MPFSAEELQEIAEGLDCAFGDEDHPMVWFIEEDEGDLSGAVLVPDDGDTGPDVDL